ncbi:protein FAM200B-like [Macrobrachium rosenbergii]|uniref:protein FAM200B-like n=1 Tax=Macrobrachium rosenbergii TaxID=79674 RepID=UPI0034D4615E
MAEANSDDNEELSATPVTPRKRKAPSKAGPHRQQRYRKEWEADSAFKPWLQDVSNDPLKAKCRVCNVVMVAELTCKREETFPILKKCSLPTEQASIAKFFQKPQCSILQNQIARAEIKLAGFLSEHNIAFNVTEHLTDLLKDIFPDSIIVQSISLKRTKATAVVTNVIGESHKKALAKKLQECKFSVMCDESTDIGSVKTSCVVVRFFYVDSLPVESKFWELYDVYNADDPESVERGAIGKSLYEGMMKTFKDHNVPIKNMIGFGADGCSVMMGVNNSVSSHFRSDCPGLTVMKSNVKVSTSNFNHSVISNHKVLHPSQTRWLSLVAVVQRLLEQWEALKLFFSEKLLATELIISSLHDPFMKVYFMFLDWVLPKFTEFNKFFQSDKAVITVLHDKVSMLFRDLLSSMDRTYVMKTDLSTVNPERHDRHLSDSQMYLGVKVMQGLNNPSIQEKKAQQQEFFQRCRSFLVVACTEIKKRYNFNYGVLSKLNCLCPKNALSSEFRERIPSLFPLASELPLIVPPDDHSLLQKLDDRWRMFSILQHELKHLVNESPDKFWGVVSQKESSFSDLANFALTALCLPHSIAECERVFSQVNLFKTKQRNRLKTRTVNGALLSASCIKGSGGSCVYFTPANDMFSRINNHAQLFQNIREHEFDLEEDS